MKRIIALTAVVLLLLALSACGGNTAPTETSSVTEAPTDAPYIDTQISEPEWTLAEGELQLEGTDSIYAENADVLYFAIVTESDSNQELWFRLSDETAALLQSQRPDDCFMTLNGEKIGGASLSDDCTIVKISAENVDGEITAWASKIRGLAE